MITSCTRCGKGYDAGSEEQANERERFCPTCWSAIFQQGCDAADHNRRVIYRHTIGWKFNPYAGGPKRRRWDEGYNYRDMVNDG